MRTTENVGFKLPNYNDNVDIEDINYNFEETDKHIGSSIYLNENGAHGLRYNPMGYFEYYNTEESRWCIAPILSLPARRSLNDTSWEDISYISSHGLGENYWAIGDTKAVSLNGKCGMLELNATYYVYIIGFNHNSEIEGSGISFGCFKDKVSNGNDICLADSNYGGQPGLANYFIISDGSTIGRAVGWQRAAIRNSILGSSRTFSANAESDTTTNPNTGTLMSLFPESLRAVMKPITKYSSNPVDDSGSDTTEEISSTIDYLPLMSEYEITGDTMYSHSGEKDYQQQYEYYRQGYTSGAYIKKKHNDLSNAIYWTRSSADASSMSSRSNDFVVMTAMGSLGTAGSMDRRSSFGISPVFLV